MSDLPSRDTAKAMLDGELGEIEGARVVAHLLRLAAQGRLLDRETIDPNRVRAAINRHVHSASEFYDGGAWIETWADIAAALGEV